MNVTDTNGAYPNTPQPEPEYGGANQPFNTPEPPRQPGSGPVYDGGMTPQNPVSMNPQLQPPGSKGGLQPQQPLQNQNLSGGLIGTIEQMLQEFLQKLQNLLKMVAGNTDQGAPPPPSSAIASQPQLMAGNTGLSAPGPQDISNVRLATPSASGTDASSTASPKMTTGDTSLNTDDPDLKKLVDKYGSDYQAASKETGVPAKLLVAVTMQESGGDVNATSTNPGNGKTDSGMNQINPDTYAAVRAEHPDKLGSNMNDPSNQIMCTALLLQHGKQKFGTYDAALRSYNSGDDQVDKNNLSNVTIGDPNYVNEVNKYAAKFK
ncbi:lytic transglycosylase domain-containing protein [Candidatus Pantoea communis]|nr:lytic transglycosylase domain-containing protein [Pantoea communis]